MSRMVRRRLLPVAVALAMATGLVGLATPASAHDVLESTNPADKSTVASVPAEVQLTFDQPAFAVGSQVIVKGPSGTVSTGQVRIVDKVVSQEIGGGAPAGAYTVLWRVTSADGHPVSGEFTFTAAAGSTGTGDTGASPAPTSTSPATANSKAPTWLWLLILLALLVPIAIFVRRRPFGPHDGDPGPG